MANVEIRVDAKELKRLGADIVRAKNAMLGRLAERGYQLLRREVPVETGNLKQGVAPPNVDYAAMQAQLVVSGRSGARASMTAEVFDKDGKKVKTVSLRANPAYNYAEVVALGNKDAVLTPKNARAFLIPVSFAPSDEGYLLAGGQVYIMRRSRKRKAANPFHERAGAQLEKEAPNITDAVLRKFFGS